MGGTSVVGPSMGLKIPLELKKVLPLVTSNGQLWSRWNLVFSPEQWDSAEEQSLVDDLQNCFDELTFSDATLVIDQNNFVFYTVGPRIWDGQ